MGFDGCILAMPSTDTVKIIDRDIVHNTINRNSVWMAQTPQVFRKDKLLKAAGLYWLRSSGDIEFSIITKEAEDELLTIHNRTPLILNNKSENLWTSDAGTDTLYPAISGQKNLTVNFHRVSKSVNNPKNTNSSLINEYTEVPF